MPIANIKLRLSGVFVAFTGASFWEEEQIKNK
jgi:hypothetical protein